MRKAPLVRPIRQEVAADWAAAAFGKGQAASLPQRGLRHAEEALETAQACGCDRAQIHRLVDFVFDRPAGELRQEIGGSGLTLLVLAEAAGLDADSCERAELERVLAKPLAHFTARNQAKNDAGFLADAEEEV